MFVLKHSISSYICLLPDEKSLILYVNPSYKYNILILVLLTALLYNYIQFKVILNIVIFIVCIVSISVTFFIQATSIYSCVIY